MQNKKLDKQIRKGVLQHNNVERRSLSDFPKERCELARGLVFQEIWMHSDQKPCYDCMCLPCELLSQFQKEDLGFKLAPHTVNPQGKTNAEIALEYGCSKRQVARLRKEGKL